jgi:Spy/CpxP family protein refolding chaperone
MRGLLSVAVCVWLCAIVLAFSAQSAPPSDGNLADPEAFAAKHIAALDKELNLTGEQKTKLRPIFINELQKVQVVLDSSLGVEARQEAIGRIHIEAHDRIESVLTPEQRKRFNDLFYEVPKEPEEEPRPGMSKI